MHSPKNLRVYTRVSFPQKFTCIRVCTAKNLRVYKAFDKAFFVLCFLVFAALTFMSLPKIYYVIISINKYL